MSRPDSNARCGITGRAPRVNEAWPNPLRISEEDAAAFAASDQWPEVQQPPEPGLYHACLEAVQFVAARVAKRKKKKVSELAKYDLV